MRADLDRTPLAPKRAVETSPSRLSLSSPHWLQAHYSGCWRSPLRVMKVSSCGIYSVWLGLATPILLCAALRPMSLDSRIRRLTNRVPSHRSGTAQQRDTPPFLSPHPREVVHWHHLILDEGYLGCDGAVARVE